MKGGNAVLLIAIVMAIVALHFGSSVFVPIVVALLAAILLDPPVVMLQSRGLSRSLASTIVIFSFLAFTGFTGWAGYRSFSRAAAQAPQYAQKFEELKIAFTKRADGIMKENLTVREPPVAPTGETARDEVQKVEVVDGMSTWRGFVVRLLGSAFEMISLALFVPLLIFYILADKENLLESSNTLMGKYWYLPKTNSEIPQMIQSFFLGNLIGGAVLMALHFILFLSLGLIGSPGLALVSGALSLIPILGAPLAILLPLAQGVIQWNMSEPLPFVLLVVAIIGFHFLVGNVLIPQVVGSRINVNPATIIIGLLFWGWVWGAIGFLLAIPLTAVIKIVLSSNDQTRAISNLMAARPRHVIPIRYPNSR